MLDFGVEAKVSNRPNAVVHLENRGPTKPLINSLPNITVALCESYEPEEEL